ELVKIDPKAIGVGQYQHDVNQAALARTLDGVVEDAVNGVGVDINTASGPLLERVAGVNATLADNIVAYRNDNGLFTTRKELKKVHAWDRKLMSNQPASCALAVAKTHSIAPLCTLRLTR